MKVFVRLWTKTYSYLIHDGSKDKRAKGTKKYINKKNLKFEDYKNFLEVTRLENEINHLEKKKENWCG